jgi:hypothetical protein
MERDRVRVVWWAPDGAPVVVPVGMLIAMTCMLVWEVWPVGVAVVVAAGWGLLLANHYWQRRQIVEHFWSTLLPHWEAEARLLGQDPEHALREHVEWYNRRFYRVLVVRLARKER